MWPLWLILVTFAKVSVAILYGSPEAVEPPLHIGIPSYDSKDDHRVELPNFLAKMGAQWQGYPWRRLPPKPDLAHPALPAIDEELQRSLVLTILIPQLLTREGQRNGYSPPPKSVPEEDSVTGTPVPPGPATDVLTSGNDRDAIGQKRAAALRSSVARRSHIVADNGERFTPSISVGALTNLGDFFQNLKANLESLEARNLNHDQVKLLEGQNMLSNPRKDSAEDYPKPAGSAAFLHAFRNYRPSHRIRALVSSVPELYRGTNFHDPGYMFAGLGK